MNKWEYTLLDYFGPLTGAGQIIIQDRKNRKIMSRKSNPELGSNSELWFEQVAKELDILGREGWEICGYSHGRLGTLEYGAYHWVLKRPIERGGK